MLFIANDELDDVINNSLSNNIPTKEEINIICGKLTCNKDEIKKEKIATCLFCFEKCLYKDILHCCDDFIKPTLICNTCGVDSLIPGDKTNKNLKHIYNLYFCKVDYNKLELQLIDDIKKNIRVITATDENTNIKYMITTYCIDTIREFIH
jgi:hypothetical protein